MQLPCLHRLGEPPAPRLVPLDHLGGRCADVVPKPDEVAGRAAGDAQPGPGPVAGASGWPDSAGLGQVEDGGRFEREQTKIVHAPGN